MRYISTRGQTEPVSFLEAVAMGLATDGGLLLPESIPDVRGELEAWRTLSYPELAERVLGLFAGDDIPSHTFRDLVQRSYATFDHDDVLPLVSLEDDLHILELFHGPTLAFKDVALQFLGNIFGYINATAGTQFNILGATSGDTGSAAICGVRGKPGINIFIMHPHNRVSPVQERQMTTVLDENVYNIAIEGSFDDGQRIMKELFADLPFKEAYSLSAINSVNWARVAAQVVYYFYAAFQVQRDDTPVDICVPTGNFGNIMAGYLAREMGAPIDRLILATNENDILSRFFNSGEYSQGDVAKTLSPSMDIQVASNFERYLYYCVGADSERVCELMGAFQEQGMIRFDSVEAANPGGVFVAGRGSNADTSATISAVFEAHGYVLDPHTAVGVHVAQQFRSDGVPCVCLATAHPAKFLDAVAQATGRSDIGHHPSIDALSGLKARCEVLPADREAIRAYIVEKLG